MTEVNKQENKLSFEFVLNKNKFEKEFYESNLSIWSNPTSFSEFRVWKTKDRFLGCYQHYTRKVFINLNLFYRMYGQIKKQESEDVMIDIISSTIEHEVLHDVMYGMGMTTTDDFISHHNIINRITKDTIKKFYYHDKYKLTSMHVVTLFPDFINNLELQNINTTESVKLL